MSRKRVVIVGASWAGLTAAKALAPQLEVTVVDPKEFLEFTPSLHTALGGGRDAATLLATLDDALVPGCRFVNGVAIALDDCAVTARTRAGLARLEYDYVLLACGCSYPAPLREAPDVPAQTREARKVVLVDMRDGASAANELDLSEPTVLVARGDHDGLTLHEALAEDRDGRGDGHAAPGQLGARSEHKLGVLGIE